MVVASDDPALYRGDNFLLLRPRNSMATKNKSVPGLCPPMLFLDPHLPAPRQECCLTVWAKKVPRGKGDTEHLEPACS